MNGASHSVVSVPAPTLSHLMYALEVSTPPPTLSHFIYALEVSQMKNVRNPLFGPYAQPSHVCPCVLCAQVSPSLPDIQREDEEEFSFLRQAGRSVWWCLQYSVHLPCFIVTRLQLRIKIPFGQLQKNVSANMYHEWARTHGPRI